MNRLYVLCLGTVVSCFLVVGVAACAQRPGCDCGPTSASEPIRSPDDPSERLLVTALEQLSAGEFAVDGRVLSLQYKQVSLRAAPSRIFVAEVQDMDGPPLSFDMNVVSVAVRLQEIVVFRPLPGWDEGDPRWEIECLELPSGERRWILDGNAIAASVGGPLGSSLQRARMLYFAIPPTEDRFFGSGPIRLVWSVFRGTSFVGSSELLVDAQTGAVRVAQ